MIEETLYKFCNSPYRWLIVISLTLVLGCAIVLPLVDAHNRKCSELGLLSIELADANRVAGNLDTFEERVEGLVTQLEELEKRTVTEDGHTEFRKRLQVLARVSKCTMRQLKMGEPVSRPWYENDSPLASRAKKSPTDKITPFVLQRWPISLSVDGSLPNMKKMLEQMRSDAMIVHAKRLEINPEGRGRKSVKLDMELWYFALVRKS